MAGTIISLTLDDGGSINKRAQDAKALNNELTKAQKLGREALNMPKTGYKAVAEPVMESSDYNASRAVAGTGSSARDFSKQASGLGTLVRLYAVWAGNIYAAGAALQALSKAADMDNMIKGMDQLGAVSGQALGTMAKRLVEITGGALSLRDAIDATTKASAAGLSQKQFEAMGEVATKASRALGRDMTDSISRLTRGIAKLEPELLDELGLYTKVGKAAEDYAKAIGKPVTALTDFEKRQAFANAVLKEGQEKFGSIKVDANPYDKLTAAVKNLSQEGLSLINTVLGPLVSALSSSPTALAGVITGIGAMLVKQAIPAIGEYRKALDDAAEHSNKKYAYFQQAAEEARTAASRKAIQMAESIADEQVGRVDTTMSRLEKIVGTQSAKVAKSVQSILGKESILDINEKELSNLDKLGAKNTRLSSIYRDLAADIRLAQQAHQDYLAIEEKELAKITASPDYMSAAAIQQRRALSAQRAAQSRSIVSNVASNTEILGFTQAMGLLNKEVKESELTKFGKGFTYIKGGITAATTAVSGFLSSITGILGVVGLVIAAFTILNSWLTKNSEEVDKFNSSLEALGQTTRTAKDVFERYNNTLSVQSLTAKANAIDALTNSMSNQVIALDKADKAAGWYDRLIDSLLIPFGKDLKSKFSSSMGEAIYAAIQDISDPKLQKQVQTQIQTLLNLKNIKGPGDLQNALDKVDPKKIIALAKEIQNAFTPATISMLAQRDAIKQVDEAQKAAQISLSELSNTLISQDPFTKFGVAMAKEGFALKDAFKDPITAAATMRDIMKDMSKIKLLPPEAQQSIIAVRDKFLAATTAAESFEKTIKEGPDALKAIRDKEYSQTYSAADKRREMAAKRSEIASAKTGLVDANAEIQKMSAQLSGVVNQTITAGFDLITKNLQFAAANSALNVQKTLVDLLPKTGATVTESANIEIKKISVQEAQLTATYNLITSMKTATLATEKNTLVLEQQRLLSKSTLTPQEIERVAEIKTKVDTIDKTVASFKSKTLEKDVNTGKLEKTPEVMDLLQTQAGFQAKLIELEGTKTTTAIKGAVDSLAADRNQQLAAVQRFIADKEAEFAKFQQGMITPEQAGQTKPYAQMSDAERNALANQQTDMLAGAKQYVALFNDYLASESAKLVKTLVDKFSAKSETAKLAGKAVETTGDTLAQKTEAYKGSTDAAENAKRTAASYKLQADAAKRVLDLDQARLEITKELDGQKTTETDNTKKILEYQLQLGAITQDQFNEKSASLDLEAVKQARIIKLEEQRIAYLIKAQEYINIINDPTASETQKAQAIELLKQTSELNNVRIDGINKASEATANLINLQNSMTEEQKGFTEIVKNGFNSMADVLTEFATTGKWTFGDMVKSMLADLLKLELKLQYMKLYSSLGGGEGILGGLGKLFGGSSATYGATTNVDAGTAFAGLENTGPMGLVYAKGGAFDSGIPKFAKGGTFTNSVVNSPTLFKFAKGTGMMGEAGPEAIMPLTRDSNGSLGVKANGIGGSGTKVDIVVNNYSSEKAETKETLDSKGNRKIEVTIGDMTAGEVTRSSSATQKAISNTFGMKPQLIRR